ncbi:class D sortase [Bacillaceae bacterium SAS-127]|nr:class D sortase [Bacillaceae bacterium SAS-127]
MQEAEARIAEYKEAPSDHVTVDTFNVKENEAFSTLEIPKLDKEIPVIEGTDADSLSKGIGHLSQSVLPGQGEQIVLSGHRDTVFREFNQIEIGDTFTVHMPYGSYSYVIKQTEIVDEDDTSVIREMGEEVLVVTTCYPFRFVGNAPERFVAYAYPVKGEE